MSAAEPFFDSNVLLYLVSGDHPKAERAEDVMAGGGSVSVQALNEFVAVARRKYNVDWKRIRAVTSGVRATCRVNPLTLEVHDLGLRLAERYHFRFYDCLIIAAAITSGCGTLYSEDLRDGQRIERLTIRNPFAGL